MLHGIDFEVCASTVMSGSLWEPVQTYIFVSWGCVCAPVDVSTVSSILSNDADSGVFFPRLFLWTFFVDTHLGGLPGRLFPSVKRLVSFRNFGGRPGPLLFLRFPSAVATSLPLSCRAVAGLVGAFGITCANCVFKVSRSEGLGVLMNLDPMSGGVGISDSTVVNGVGRLLG